MFVKWDMLDCGCDEGLSFLGTAWQAGAPWVLSAPWIQSVSTQTWPLGFLQFCRQVTFSPDQSFLFRTKLSLTHSLGVLTALLHALMKIDFIEVQWGVCVGSPLVSPVTTSKIFCPLISSPGTGLCSKATTYQFYWLSLSWLDVFCLFVCLCVCVGFVFYFDRISV